MTADQKFAVITARRESLEPFSVAWWESRTAEQLRDIINRGFAGGPEFPGAVAEIERRAREETRRLRELAATEALRRKKRKLIIWGIVVSVFAITALLGYWLAR